MSIDCTRSCRVMARKFCGEPWKLACRSKCLVRFTWRDRWHRS
jgi:hypothetical protein